MHQDNYPVDTVVGRRVVEDAFTALAESETRDLMPADGSIARSGVHVSVFCAPCHRWIDCQADIPPEVAWERHGTLIH